MQEQPFGAVPNRQQLRWQEMGMYAFIHFTVNTFTNLEWGLGTEAEDVFNPTDLDCDQWCRALSENGFKGAVLTAKHHDGFCLWPSKYTTHSVKYSKWRDGKGDVVGDFVAACRKYGLKVGLYLSPWDRHEKTYGSGEPYNQFYRNQLQELLSTYGGENGRDIFITWFDGACGEGPNGKVQVYDFDGCVAIIRKYAPDAAIMGHMGENRDIRWCGNEAGFAGNPNWATISEYSINTIHNGTPGGRHYWPSEVDVSIRKGWFYHDHEKPHSLEHLLDIYFHSVGRGSCLNLNVPPDRRGRFADADIKRLKEWSAVLSKCFATDFCSHIETPEPYWTPGPEGTVFELGQKRELNIIELKEYNQLGQRVAAFTIEFRNGKGEWELLASEKTISFRRLLRTKRVMTDALRLKITESLAKPLLCKFGAFYMPPILFAPHISRDAMGTVTLSTNQEAEIYYTTDGSAPTKQSRRFTEPFRMTEAGEIRALAVLPDGLKNEYDTLELHPESSFRFGIARDGMKVIETDSEYDDQNRKENILADTGIWISSPAAAYPHHVTIDTGKSRKISGFIMTPGSWENGYFSRFRFYTGDSPESVNRLAAEGTFDNIQNNPVPQEIAFAVPVEARYIRLEAFDPVRTDSHTGKTFASMGLLEIF